MQSGPQLMQCVATEVPEQWREARLDCDLASAYAPECHPFHRRFTLVSRLCDDALRHLVQFLCVFGTAACYGLRMSAHGARWTGKRREFLEHSEAHWKITPQHRARLELVAARTGESFYALQRIDQKIRRRRANWDPQHTITTPCGRSFLYVLPCCIWLDVSFTGTTDEPQPSSV